MVLFDSVATCRVARHAARAFCLAVLLVFAMTTSPQLSFAQVEAERDKWVVDCDQGAKCVLYYVTSGLQILIGEELEGDRLLVEIRLGPSNEGAPVSVRVDTGWIAGLTVAECANEENCRLIIDLSADDELVDQFKLGSDAMIAYIIDNGQTILMIPVTLSGFSDGFNQLTGG